MAIPWMVVLRNVPWTDVIRNAPRVAEGAKKLWSAVGGKTREPQSPDQGMDANASSQARMTEPGAVAELQARLATLEAAATDLHDQMLASSELIKTLADQNARLIERVEANRIRLAWLSGTLGVVGIVTVIGLILALID
jgi:hypothetical protein